MATFERERGWTTAISRGFVKIPTSSELRAFPHGNVGNGKRGH